MKPFSLFRLDSLRSLQAFQLLRFLSVILVSIVFARLIPDRGLIGFYEKLLLIGGISTSFWVSGIINPLLPYFSDTEKEKQGVLITNSVILLSCFSVLTFFCLHLLTTYIIHSHYDLFYIFLLFNLFNAPAFLTEYLLLLRKQPKLLLGYGIIVFLLQSLSLSLPLFWDASLHNSLYFLCITAILRYGFLIGFVFKNYGFKFDMNVMRSFIKRIYPYFFSILIGSSMGYVDSLFISYYYSDAEFAIYRYGARELFFVLLMANAFSNAMSAELANHHKIGSLTVGLNEMKQRSLKLIKLLFPITILLIFISKPLFGLVYNQAFIPSAVIFNVYLLLIISRLIFPQTVLLSLQKNKLIFKASLIEWIANIVLDAILLYFFGMIGIAVATVIAFMIEKLVLVWYCSREGVTLNSYMPLKTWFLYSALTIFALIISFVFIK